ncbi:hypothetical protein C0991_006594 [Blastosporella zonata]|nr:hypothetical protein C0991_006594 [Blastosporella zonata]
MSHYIRTVQTDFTARAAPQYPGSSSAAHTGLLVNLAGLMSTTDKYPGLGHADWRSPSGTQPPYTRRTRRATAVSYRSPHSSSRRTAPPPPPRTSYAYTKFDPFSDDIDSLSTTDNVLYRTPRTTPASLSASSAPASSSFTLHIPSHAQAQHQQQFDPNARSRLVAGILLNRVHAVGRPMRRRSIDCPKEYVKSGLSSVVSVEA